MSSSSSKKVLIVEDNRVLSLLEERLLHRMGHEVVGKATNGLEAIELFKELQPDFIIMDVALDGNMDGIETTNRIRKYADVPVILVSGNPDRCKKACLTEKGITEFVAKPFTHRDLTESISRICAHELEPGAEFID